MRQREIGIFGDGRIKGRIRAMPSRKDALDAITVDAAARSEAVVSGR
ncbi:hypothetical protein [Bradyrhizobium cenepequi]|nr:hypothetical protein [Bradyrhizobium cenepequi]MCA6106087.1 hypothetical protein [Bradyrhizobium cenepequi]